MRREAYSVEQEVAISLYFDKKFHQESGFPLFTFISFYHPPVRTIWDNFLDKIFSNTVFWLTLYFDWTEVEVLILNSREDSQVPTYYLNSASQPVSDKILSKRAWSPVDKML